MWYTRPVFSCGASCCGRAMQGASIHSNTVGRQLTIKVRTAGMGTLSHGAGRLNPWDPAQPYGWKEATEVPIINS